MSKKHAFGGLATRTALALASVVLMASSAVAGTQDGADPGAIDDHALTPAQAQAHASVLGGCSSDADCDDNDPCTRDVCDLNLQCQNTFSDTVGPDITCSSVSPFTTPADRAPVPTTWEQPRVTSREELLSALMAQVSNPTAAAYLMEKIHRLDETVVAYDGRAPEHSSDQNEALSCGAPVGSGTVGNANGSPFNFYDVILAAGTGGFTANTGVDHPDGAGLNVIFPSPGTSDITFHVHNNNTNYLAPSGGLACAFNPPDTGAEPNNIGVEQEWTRTPVAGLDLTLRQEIVTFGTNDDDSGVRLTLCTTNEATSTIDAEMGVRWQIDYMNSGDDGPGYAPVTCDPFVVGPERFTEHEFSGPEIEDFYRIQNNTNSPIFGNFTNTTAIAGFPDTGTPDRLIYGVWGPLSGSAWNYVANEGANADNDSAVLYYFGYAPADAMVIPPGATECRSVVIFTKGQNQDCGTFTPGTGVDSSVEICPGDDATVGATASDTCDPNPTVTLFDSTPGAPSCVGNPCSSTFPTSGTYVYTWQAEDFSGNTTTCNSTVVVLDATDPRCNQPPSCDAGGPYTAQCVDADIDGATVSDPNGDLVSYAWSSSNSAVAVVPASGSVVATTGTPIPTSVATLTGDACGVSSTLTLTVTDDDGAESDCETTVTFSDQTAPSIDCPAPATVECAGDVPAPDTGDVVASDTCSGVGVTFEGDLSDGLTCPETITRTYRAADACNNADTCEQTIIVDDTIAPTVDVILAPAVPLPPASANSARSVCSAGNSRLFQVVCGDLADNCDAMPDREIVIVSTTYEVPEPGVCVELIEELVVECDDLIEIQLTAPACPSSPQSAVTATSANSDGVPVISGQSVVLVVTATDDCGNVTTATFDPAAEPSPLCDDVLSDGTCCPAIEPPPGDCDVTECGRAATTAHGGIPINSRN